MFKFFKNTIKNNHIFSVILFLIFFSHTKLTKLEKISYN
jgi:hypothetical protein